MADIMIKVDNVDMPCPSVYQWGLQDVSAAESGRDEVALMHKNRVAQKRKIQLAWNGKNWQTVSQILTAFNPQYVQVTYPDMLSGRYETRTFYVGDRSAPVKIWFEGTRKIMETLSFDIIER